MADGSKRKGGGSRSNSSSSSSSSKKPKLHDLHHLGPHYRGKTTDPKMLKKLALFPNGGDHYDQSKPSQFLIDLPPFLWKMVIIENFGLRDLAQSREVCAFFEPFWQDRSKNNKLPLRVPQDVSSLQRAVEDVAPLLSAGSYTKDNPLKIELSKGVHEVDPREGPTKWMETDYVCRVVTTRCSMILVGVSREETIVQGGFRIEGESHDHVRLETMTVANPKGNGVVGYAGAKFEGKELSIEGCSSSGVIVNNTQSTLTDCTVMNCGRGGICSVRNGVIHIYGHKTRVTGNNTAEFPNPPRGLFVNPPAQIILHAPLTKQPSHDTEAFYFGIAPC